MDFDIPQNLQYNTSGLGGVYADKVHLTEKSTALNDLVIIKIVEQDSNRLQHGGIFLPDVHTTNCELLKGELVSVGPDALKFNIHVGDIVLYDKWSAFYKPPDTAGTFIITKVENIICTVEE